MFNYLSSVFYILGSSGFITFLSRVMEVQFNRSSAGGSMITGPISIMGMVLGLLASGFFITKYKPPPKYLFFWNVIVGLISMFGSLTYSNLGCEGGNTLMLNGSLRSCNTDCYCEGITYSPVCDVITKETFFSPCHAGCREFDEKANIYKNCVCTEMDIIMTDVFKRKTISSTDIPIYNQTTDKIEVSTETKSPVGGRRITLYDVYDEDLKLGRSAHDHNHDDTIDANDLYDYSQSYDDSQEEGNSQEQLLTHNDDDEIETETETAAPVVRRDVNGTLVDRILTPGACFGDCSSAYYTFTLISLVVSLVNSSGRIGNILLNFR